MPGIFDSAKGFVSKAAPAPVQRYGRADTDIFSGRDYVCGNGLNDGQKGDKGEDGLDGLDAKIKAAVAAALAGAYGECTSGGMTLHFPNA